MGAWVGAVKKCGACTAATRVTISRPTCRSRLLAARCVGGRLGAFWVARCILGAWVGAVKKCGACTAATRVSVSGNLEDLFDGLSLYTFSSL